MIGMAKPYVGQEEIDAVVEVMKSGMLACGEVVTNFENKFASYIGMEHGVASCNGTTALHVALLTLGIGEGDKVLTSPFSFIASGNSILFNRSIPVFVDIDPATYLLDPIKLETYLERHYDPAMKAILAVHLFGLPCNMPKILEIANKYNLKVIEDCAQSHGAEINGQKTGSFGEAACFSFYPTKNMTTGEGGITLFKSKELANLGRKYINHGRVDQYLHDVLGFNYRMTNIAAAIGLEQLKRVDGFNELRRVNAKQYDNGFKQTLSIAVPFVPEGFKHVYHQYTIALNNVDRTALQEYMKTNDVASAVVYPFSMNEQPFYRDICVYDKLTNAEVATKVVLSLPVHPGLSVNHISKVIELINSFIK